MIEARCLPPLFDTDEAFQIRQSFYLALFGLGLILVIGHAASSPGGPGIFDSLLAWRSWTLEFLCGAALFFLFPLFLLSAGIKGLVDGISIKVKKKRWIKDAASAQVPIVDKKEEHNAYAESAEDLFSCTLALQLPAEMSSEPGGQVLWVRVSQATYQRYRLRDKARIYYSAARPGVFILEGE